MADVSIENRYGDNSTMIRLYKGDEKKYVFPVRPNWKYQVVIEASFKNSRTGKTYHFGRSTGRNARADYCCSLAHAKFSLPKQIDEALDHGFARCAGGEEYEAGDSGIYVDSDWRQWKLTKIYAVYLILWRSFKIRKSGIRPKIKPVTFQQKVAKKPTQAELEKKYPTPKRYLKAQEALKRKIKAQESRRLKREKKQRALKRKR